MFWGKSGPKKAMLGTQHLTYLKKTNKVRKLKREREMEGEKKMIER